MSNISCPSLEEFHKTIHINLKLLAQKYYSKYEFQEGMFAERNQDGFLNVGQYLLSVIDPAECKRTIPWPLDNNKSQHSEFRTNFTKFIKMINSKYPEARIPEINASHLQFPGGPNFVKFMCKLSSFALELDLKRKMSSDELKDLLPKPFVSKQPKDMLVKINIVKGARYKEEVELINYKQYLDSAYPILLELQEIDSTLKSKILSTREKFQTEISNLLVDNDTKNRLKDFEDFEAIKEYNQATELKLNEIESRSRMLCRYRDLAKNCYEQKKLAGQISRANLCLDGRELHVTPAADQLAGCLIRNNNGEVKLLPLLKAGVAAATKLVPPTTLSIGSLLPFAQKLLTECETLQSRMATAERNLNQLCNDNAREIKKLQPVIYGQLKEKKIPEHFKYLSERPFLNFNFDCFNQENMPFKKGRHVQLCNIIKKKKTVVCMMKGRQQLARKQRPSMTPISNKNIFATPFMRRHLDTRIPSITKTQVPSVLKLNNITPLQTPNHLLTPVKTPQPVKPRKSLVKNEFKPTSTSKRRSTSLVDIIERYKKIRENMSLEVNS